MFITKKFKHFKFETYHYLKKKRYISSNLLSLSTKKKKNSNLQILHVPFCNFFLKISKIEMVSQKIYFILFFQYFENYP